MGISQSMFTGVTGLAAMADNMSVVANNIANANAKGFKYDRGEFQDLLSADLGGSMQMGRGTRMADIRTMHTQGGLAVTDNLTDLAIQGNGFFLLRNNFTEVQESGGLFFSRVGSFHFDKNGFLSDAGGGHVQGYLADQKGVVSTRLTDIRIMTNNLPPTATAKLDLNVNLDSRAKIMDREFDLNDAEKTSNFNTTVNVFDSHGRAHQMTVYFCRAEDTEGISWKWHATVDSKEVTDGSGSDLKEIGSGLAKFNNAGNLLEEETYQSEANFSEGAFPGQVIDFDFGKSITEGGNGIGASTSTAARSTTVFHHQDGYEAGNLKSLKIDLDGTILGVYTNGIQRTLGAMALAAFENTDGLSKAGRNQFIATIKSGPPKIGQAQTGTLGSIYASTLEESNVDLASQFVNMILTQRGFQANSRSITTTDQMMEEVINMKR